MDNMIFNFSGIYERETFYQNKNFKRLDLKDLPGTYGFCDDVAAKAFRKIMATPRGLHFLDNGNYHYLSLFFLEKITEPFEMVLLDHHADAGEPAFGGLLSCGDWVRGALASCENLRRVVAVGPDKVQQMLVDKKMQQRILFLSESADLKTMLPVSALPVYISLDKDVLSPDVLKTDWDQGAMTAGQLERDLAWLMETRQIIGMDVCGEAALDAPDNQIARNDAFNQSITALWQRF